MTWPGASGHHARAVPEVTARGDPPAGNLAARGGRRRRGPAGEPGPERLDNPYQDAQVYVNPDWAQQVLDQAAATPGPLGDQMAQVAAYPTAVWLDEIADITAGRGLAGHLDAALAQDADLVQLVIYNLPNRSCDERGPSGELVVAAGGEQRYRSDFIDPIAEIVSRPEYADLRIVVVVEPQALITRIISPTQPTLACLEANAADAYVDGIRYAVSELGAISNAYLYLLIPLTALTTKFVINAVRGSGVGAGGRRSGRRSGSLAGTDDHG